MKHEPKKLPSRTEALIFRGKAALLQLQRGFSNAVDRKIKRFPQTNKFLDYPLIAESKTDLWTEDNLAEKFLTAGKIQNLRVAVKRIHGVETAAGETFSFWAHVGRARRAKGFVVGRELREGCLIPNVGGGLCQLSNALYDAALRAGFEIVERHAHSQVVRGSLAESGRDATVFWNYVDLRFKSNCAFRIEAELTADKLIVRFKSHKTSVNNNSNIFTQTESPSAKPLKTKIINGCASCGVEQCFRSFKAEPNINFGRAAFLVDEFSPEFDQYLQETRQTKDLLFVPLDGKRFRKANYAWTTKGFEKVEQSLLTTAIRAYKSRKLAAQGASRQQNLLQTYKKLAENYAGKLPFDATHLIVQQNLLPFLWQNGALGGRTFDVLMTALPIEKLQAQLDFAASLHQESQTLGDFRADVRLLEAEAEALKNARNIITPHSQIADLFVKKAVLLDWQTKPPQARQRTANKIFTIVFPASTVGRKGAYELREALRGLENVRLITIGAQLEGADFWRGFDVERFDSSQNWLDAADLVVLPAYVEHKPRRLLQAAARGVPIVASTACGLANVAGVTNIEAGDAATLRHEICRVLSESETTANAAV